MSDSNCPLCNKVARSHISEDMARKHYYNCPRCGEYFTSSLFMQMVSNTLSENDKSALSGYVRETMSLGKQDITISYENYQDILNSPIVARNISDKLKKLILFVRRRTDGLGYRVPVDPDNDYTLCYAASPLEFIALAQEAQRLGYLIYRASVLQLTYEGMFFAEKLIDETNVSDSAFVAMWFSPEMKDVFDNSIKPAIEAEECGSFKAFRVDNHEHNNDITDEIIAGIKACRFMVADLTGYRGGVYYEAGYAKGLGKPVIFTCRKDWFTGEFLPDGKPIKERIHFDINHQNIIVWEEPEDLKQRIINRIRATII